MFEDRPHQRHFIPVKAVAEVTSWLDLYPPTEQIETPILNAPNPKLISRINALKKTLIRDIKPNIDIRAHFLRVNKSGKKACFLCSGAGNPPTNCGLTCAHLSPLGSLQVPSFVKPLWRAEAIQSVKIYYRILKEIEKKGSRARNSHVAAWERATQALRKGALNQSETKHENGWTDSVEYSKAEKAGVDVKWTFESAWGTGLRPAEEIAPDEDVPGQFPDGLTLQ